MVEVDGSWLGAWEHWKSSFELLPGNGTILTCILLVCTHIHLGTALSLLKCNSFMRVRKHETSRINLHKMPPKCVKWQEMCNMSGTCKNKTCCRNSMLHYGTPMLDCGTLIPNHRQQRKK